MKIAVIGANGKTGKLFVQTALEKGHDVIAGYRTHKNLQPHPHLTMKHCNAVNRLQVEDFIVGCDAVVSVIGHNRHSHPKVQSIATENIISAMKKHKIRRLVSLTGTGARFQFDNITLLDRILNASIKLIDPKRISDGIAHVELIKDSGLDWTIIRVLKLQNTRPMLFELRDNGPTKPFVSRKEVAQAILQVLELHSFIQRAPIIGYASRKQ